MRTTKAWCSNHGGQADHRLRLPGTAYRRALVRPQPSRLRHDSLHGEGRRVATCGLQPILCDGVPGTPYSTPAGLVLARPGSIGDRPPSGRCAVQERPRLCAWKIRTGRSRSSGVPGTPYLTAWANSGKSGRASREQALRLYGHPAGTPGATGVERLRPRENGQRLGGGEWGETD